MPPGTKRGAQAKRKASPWTAEEDDQLRHLVRCGWSVRRIAGVLNRGVYAIYHRAIQRYGGIGALRGGMFAVRNAIEVAELLGLSIAPVRFAIDVGWLRAHRNYGRTGRKTQWLRFLIGDEALEEFLSNPATWMLWRPERITDPDWREHATRLRRDGGEWLTVEDMEARLGRSNRRVQEYMRCWSATGEREVVWVMARWYVWEARDGAQSPESKYLQPVRRVERGEKQLGELGEERQRSAE